MEPLLARKDVRRCYGIDRTTLWRWERDGLKFVGGRIKEPALVWWLEQRDAARSLGMKPRAFLAMKREVREKLLEAALRARGGNDE